MPFCRTQTHKRMRPFSFRFYWQMKKKTIMLFGFILLKFLLQYLVMNGVYDLHRDEYLHLDQANHLAWGYQSVPPVTSLISYIIKLLGSTVF